MNYPCSKCDGESHGNSMRHFKSMTVWSQCTPNPHQIPCHLSRFSLFFMLKHDMDFGQVQVMEFSWHWLRKWWDLHQDFILFLPKLPSKRHEKTNVTLLSFLLKKEYILKRLCRKERHWTFTGKIRTFYWEIKI